MMTEINLVAVVWHSLLQQRRDSGKISESETAIKVAQILVAAFVAQQKKEGLSGFISATDYTQPGNT